MKDPFVMLRPAETSPVILNECERSFVMLSDSETSLRFFASLRMTEKNAQNDGLQAGRVRSDK